jgi:hypothetical protein
MPHRPSRTPIGLGRLAPRFGGSGPCIVTVEQQFRFVFLDKWIYLCCYCLGRGDYGNKCVSHIISPPRNVGTITLHTSVSIGVHGQKAPGPIVLSIQDGKVLMGT